MNRESIENHKVNGEGVKQINNIPNVNHPIIFLFGFNSVSSSTGG